MVVGLGIWLWQGGSGLMPVERELVFVLPADRAEISELDLQLYSDDGVLLQRERLFYPPGARTPPEQVTLKATLRRGRYEARLFTIRRGEQVPRSDRLAIGLADTGGATVALPPK